MNDIDIRGMIFIAVLRCSMEEQMLTSLPQQRRTCETYAKEHGIQISEFVEFGGYSATQGEQIEPLIEIIRRKSLASTNYSGILLDSYARFVRSEVDSARLFVEASDADLLIVTVKDGLMMGSGSWAKRGAAADQSEGTGREISRNINRGVTLLIDEGIIPPVQSFSYGVDRLYFDAKNNPLFRVRRATDGRKLVLAPEHPFAVRREYSRNKQKLDLRDHGDRFEYVPSESAEADVAREILSDFYVGGTSPYLIARKLNSRPTPSPAGKLWNTTGVRALVGNPVYIGVSVGNTRESGVHTKRCLGTPIVFQIARRPGKRRDGKGKLKRVRTVYRPPDEWIVKPQTRMENFIVDTVVRAAALAEWERKKREGWLPTTKGTFAKSPKHHGQSRSFLSKMIRVKSDLTPMVGIGAMNSSKRYYRYYKNIRQEKRPYGHPPECVNAEIVEAAFKTAMSEVLTTFPYGLDQKIRRHVAEYERERSKRSHDLPELRREKDDLERWYQATYSTASSRGKTLLADERRRAEERLDEIGYLISTRDGAMKGFEMTVPEIVVSVKKQFNTLWESIDLSDTSLLRRLAQVFLSSLTYDANDKLIEMEFSLPTWALFKRNSIVANVLNKENAGHCDSVSKNKSPGIPLASKSLISKRLRRFGSSHFTSSHPAAHGRGDRKAAGLG